MKKWVIQTLLPLIQALCEPKRCGFSYPKSELIMHLQNEIRPACFHFKAVSGDTWSVIPTLSKFGFQHLTARHICS